MSKLGFIGIGNMGDALFKSVIQKGLVSADDIYIFDVNSKRVKEYQQQFGVLTAQSGSAMVAACDYVLLAVKPNVCAAVLKECAETIKNKVLISIVAGWSKDDIEKIVPGARILRVMPNTPCLINEGMIALDMNNTLFPEEFEFAKAIFETAGKVEIVPTSYMDGIVGISGSGPAYVYIFIESLADAGVRAGLPRDLAYRIAAQMTLGSAKMVLETNKHPGALKDAVCSPGGTTIEAVTALERGGFRAAIQDAVEACIERLHEL